VAKDVDDPGLGLGLIDPEGVDPDPVATGVLEGHSDVVSCS
jgi:hypothetical protein